jgi:multidrug efflux pump
MGTGVIGGMLFATFFGLLLVPVFYVIVRRLAGDKLDGGQADADDGIEEIKPFD